MLLDTDWNWRLDAARQGALRAVADIGSHWLDLARFVTGRPVVEVLADLHTFVTERDHPVGEVETFGGAAPDAPRGARADGERRRRRAAAALRGRAARDVHDQPGLGRAQEHDRVGAGRIDERHGVVVAGSRNGSGSATVTARTSSSRRTPRCSAAAGVPTAGYPAGHVEGYPDTFRALFAEVYRDVAAGAPAARPTYPTFADGHDVVLVCEAVATSARAGTWAKVERS